MKKCFTLAVTGLLFTACTKENLQEDTTVASASFTSPVTGAYVSDWEQYSSWNKRDSADFTVFYSHHEASQLNQDIIKNGVVLTYSVSNSSDASYAQFTRPVALPFYFLPLTEKVNNTFYWYDVVQPGVVTVSFRVAKTRENVPSMGGGASLNGFKFRYFILSKSFLDKKGVDAKTVKNHYTYDQLVQLVGVHQ